MKIAVFERSGEKYVGQVLENENIIQRFDLTLKDFEFSGVMSDLGIRDWKLSVKPKLLIIQKLNVQPF